MKCTQFYPVLMTGDVAGTVRFYIDNFRFLPVFESDWYVHLQSSEDESVNLAVMAGDHETIPAAGRGRTAGLLLNFEVEDVDAEHDCAQAVGLPVPETIHTSQDWAAWAWRETGAAAAHALLLSMLPVRPVSPPAHLSIDSQSFGDQRARACERERKREWGSESSHFRAGVVVGGEGGGDSHLLGLCTFSLAPFSCAARVPFTRAAFPRLIFFQHPLVTQV